MSGGRLFQSFAVLGKNEYLSTSILECGIVYLDLRVREGCILFGNWITRLCLIL